MTLPNAAPSDSHAVPERSEVSVKEARVPGKVFGRWGRRAGVFLFCFFLIKGLAWLTVPAAIAYFASR